MIDKNITTDAEETFDKEAEYTAEVVPVLKQLSEICQKYSLPYLINVVYKSDKDHFGQGLVMNNGNRECNAAYKISVLGHIANGDVGVDTIAKAAVAAALFGGEPLK